MMCQFQAEARENLEISAFVFWGALSYYFWNDLLYKN